MAKKKTRHPAGSWADRVEKVRKRLGLKQGEVAERLRVSRRSWNAWETGAQIPSQPYQHLIELLEQGKI